MTISEIAKIAGVSSAAVSRYLNGGSLSKEKQVIIKKVIEENNYVPSSSARSLRTKKSRQIGVIVPKINSESVPKVISGIGKVLNEYGYQFLLADTDSNLAKELEYLETINNSQMDGVIFLGSIMTKEHREILSHFKKPIVIVGQKIAKYACVYHDDKQAAFDMTSLLLKAGCKEIGYIGVTEKDKAAGKQRSLGVVEAMQAYSRTEKDVVRIESSFSIESGYEAMQRLLQKSSTIDGVFCATDEIAIGALTYLKDIGKKVPEEIKICGIGDHQISKIISPKLTTARYHYETSGIEAAKLLMDIIKDESKNPVLIKQLMLGYEIIHRETI